MIDDIYDESLMMITNRHSSHSNQPGSCTQAQQQQQKAAVAAAAAAAAA